MMRQSAEKEFLYGIRQEASRNYWRRPKWELYPEEIVNLLVEETWNNWLIMERSDSVEIRRQQAMDLAHSARWRVVRRLNRQYLRKVVPDAYFAYG